MKAKIIVLICVAFIIMQKSFAQADTILNRYRQYLLQTVKAESDLKQLTQTLNANGQWNDINYQDTEPANWKPLIHLKRVKELALVWSNPKSSFYHQTSIKKTIDIALDHWLKTRYKSSNWWHNEIGVPQQIRDIIVLLQTNLSPLQLKLALEVLAQYRVNSNATGANLTWSADLGFHYGLLTGNSELMQKCRDLMVNEIKITTREGVQPDFSFHQHGSRLQMFQYGKAFLWENARIAYELRNTVFAFPQNKIDILTDLVLQGWQWMARGIHTVPGTMDRSSSRKNELHAADIRLLLPYLIALAPEKKDSLNNIFRNQNGIGSLNGFRYFAYSDFTAYHQKNFSFFLKTISDRTLATESINHENLKGHLLNSGDAYLIQDGKEYYNLMPVWNWEYLPGVTSFRGADKIKRLPFAGSVSNGAVGFTSMDYFLQDKNGERSITAKKSWFCIGDKIVCLVAGLKGNNVDSAYTALDQCRWRGDVVVDGRYIVDEGDYFFPHCKWIYHSGLAYIPIGKTGINVHLQTVTGNWQNINKSETDEWLKEKVFMPALLHLNLNKAQSFVYVLAHCVNSKEANEVSKKPGFKIIRNDTTCQSVLTDNGEFMTSFFQPASIKIEGRKLSVDKPCLILITSNKIYISDPFHKGETLKLTLGNKTYSIVLNGQGFSTEINL
jgi:chondroitin AC lyase